MDIKSAQHQISNYFLRLLGGPFLTPPSTAFMGFLGTAFIAVLFALADLASACSARISINSGEVGTYQAGPSGLAAPPFFLLFSICMEGMDLYNNN